jgi:hypothetical protein
VSHDANAVRKAFQEGRAAVALVDPAKLGKWQ